MRYSALLALSCCLFFQQVEGEEAGWDYQLARRFSSRLAEAEKKLAAIQTELPGLPEVPVADQGGTGGFATLYGAAEPGKGEDYSVTLRFPKAGAVDLVSLVPARRYGVKGLEPQYGLPDAFTVDLLDGEGKAIARIGEQANVWADPVRAGDPFLFRVAPAVQAQGLRITANRLRLDPERERYVHAWSEAFVFEGERNLAPGAEVTASGDSTAEPWQWKEAFLVDGLTTLGLPELPAGEHQNVGWMSDQRAKVTDMVWVELDLGELKQLDSVRLSPASPPTPDLPSGFGFPRRFKVAVYEGDGGDRSRKPVTVKEVESANPGHNPVTVDLGPTRGRHVRVEFTELWKAYEAFPAYGALSEVEVLNGVTNMALGAPVRAEGGMGALIGSGSQVWNAPSLTDGFGPEGKLVPVRDWLAALNHRLELAQRQHGLESEKQAIIAGWRRTGWWSIALFGGLSALLLIALPIRYRMREKRQLAEVRDRIAGDLHDEVGSNLGSIQMFADLAERHADPSSELKRIQRIAAETVSAVRDIVWLLRPQGDHRIATVEHLRETCSIMLEPRDWKFTANEAAWQCEMSDDANRHLFLFVREGLHNILRHAEGAKVEVAIECDAKTFRLSIADDGCGIAPERLERPATLRALRKRAEALDAEFSVQSEPGKGTKLGLVIPLGGRRKAGPGKK